MLPSHQVRETSIVVSAADLGLTLVASQSSGTPAVVGSIEVELDTYVSCSIILIIYS